jgi:hypothetical protein
MQDTENTNQITEGDELGSDNRKAPTGQENSDMNLENDDSPSVDNEPGISDSFVIPPLPGLNETPDIESLGSQDDIHPSDDQSLSTEAVVESKLQSFLRRLIRWAAGILIIFGLGLIAGIYMFYKPAIQEAERKINIIEVDLNSAIEENEGLKSQIATLQPYKSRNDGLLVEQSNLLLHIAILDARVDVADALLAIDQEDIVQAKVILNQTEIALDHINDLIAQDLKDAVTDMKTRLDLILSEIDRDHQTAQIDLGTLEEDLLHLEDSLIPK